MAALPMALAALAMALAASAPARAQAVGDFQLPTATPTAAPRAQGPVDAEHPVATPQASPTQPRPAATESAAAAPTPSPTPAAAPRPTAPAAPRALPKRTAAPVAPAPVPVATPQASAIPTGEASAAPPTAAPVPEASPSPIAATPGDGHALPWPWIGGGAALLALLGGGFARARRRRPPVEDEGEQVPDEAPVPDPAPDPVPQPVVLPEPSFAMPPVAGVDIALAPARLSATLINVAIDYALTVTNTGSVPLEGLAIGADMIGAHASLPADRQLAGDGTALPQRHAVASLAPGESATIKGDIRLPLAEVTPIRQGEAALFVPLVRLRLTAQAGDSPIVLLRTWVAGEPPVGAGGGLRAFRLDLGPRIYSEISARLL